MSAARLSFKDSPQGGSREGEGEVIDKFYVDVRTIYG